jgi:hypothetical protein
MSATISVKCPLDTIEMDASSLRRITLFIRGRHNVYTMTLPFVLIQWKSTILWSVFLVFVLSYYVSSRSQCHLVMSATISVCKRCSVRLYLRLFVGSCLIYVICVCLPNKCPTNIVLWLSFSLLLQLSSQTVSCSNIITFGHRSYSENTLPVVRTKCPLDTIEMDASSLRRRLYLRLFVGSCLIYVICVCLPNKCPTNIVLCFCFYLFFFFLEWLVLNWTSFAYRNRSGHHKMALRTWRHIIGQHKN